LKPSFSALGDNISGVSYFQGRPRFLGVLSIVDMIARDGQDMLLYGWVSGNEFPLN
jgi:hypothetical protein